MNMMRRMQCKGLSFWRIVVICFISLIFLQIFASSELTFANSPPIVSITSPADGSIFIEEETISFSGTGNDAEDGPLSGSSLVWTSSIDGEIGIGTSFSRTNLSVGTHNICLTATDSQGATGSCFILITINAVGTIGWIEGIVTDFDTGDPIGGAQIETDYGVSVKSLPDGTYLMLHPAGTFKVTAKAFGYIPLSYPGVVVIEFETTSKDFELVFDDDDNDGMPDDWEIQYGLDPLDETDASGDLDGDGVSNLEEYLAGTDPTNAPPDTPVLSSPDNGQSNESLTPELQIEAFSDPDGDTHAETTWQISTESNFSSLVLDITSDSHRTSLTVPEFIVTVNTTYYWRVKFSDDRGAASEWSDPYWFTTIDVSASDDTNSNGIPDDQDVDSTVDMDGDGTPDIDQPDDIKSVNTVVGDGQIGIKEGTNVTSIESFKSIDPDTISDTTNKPDEIPLGLITFKVTVDNLGDTAEVTVYLSEPAPSGAKWYKYDIIHGWREYPYATFNSDGTVTLLLKDGDWEYGDCDGTANRIIVDPSGLGTAPTTPPPSGGGGGVVGCFIATAAYGSLMESHVKVLRDFRDHFLLTNPPGMAFVDLYYTYSPPVADFIANHDTVRLLVRWSLLPIVGVSWMTLNIGLSVILVLIGLLICFMGAGATIALRRMRIRCQV